MTSIASPISSSASSTPLERRWFAQHGQVLASFALCLLVLGWFVTWGDWRLFDAERFGGYYDAQARSILQGRLDVPPAAIGFEAFVRNGKSYGYFGVAPALLRMPLLLLFPHMDGHWSRLMMLIGAGLSMLYAYRLMLLFRGSQPANATIDRLFVLAAGLGSTLVFLASRSYTYHDAILWGATFAIMFAYYVIKYLQAGAVRALLFAGACCFLSFMSRATAGAGALLVMCILTLMLAGAQPWFAWANALARAVVGIAQPPRAGVPAHATQASNRLVKPWHAWIAGAVILLTLGTYLSINYAKFRTFDGVPVQYYSLYIKDPQRMAVTGGKQIHLSNLRTTLLAYLGPAGAQIGGEFPWLYMRVVPRVFPEAKIDVVEPHSSFLACMPALLLLGMVGCRRIIVGSTEALRAARLAIAGLLIGGSIIFVTVGITQRYLHDLYPFLIVVAAAGAAHLSLVKRRTAMLSFLVMVSILMNAAFAYDFQREIVWGVPEQKRAQLTQIRGSIDRLLVSSSAAESDPVEWGGE
jgi:hypothetical protein